MNTWGWTPPPPPPPPPSRSVPALGILTANHRLFAFHVSSSVRYFYYMIKKQFV